MNINKPRASGFTKNANSNIIQVIETGIIFVI